jgi:type II secretory pathway pseudopilin PulG
MRRRGRSEDGLTLIETLAALTVLSIVTLGIFPVIASSLRAAILSRSLTLGKAVALQGMERIRGLPYYIAYSAQTTKVDVLDLYFPCANSSLPQPECPVSGVEYSDGTFTTTCDGVSDNPACPRDLPPDYSLIVDFAFVQPVASGSPQSYEMVQPPDGYVWNSISGADLPASQLVNVIVTAEWEAAGETRTFSLESLLGDRKFGQLALQGAGQIQYIVQILASFTDESGRDSDLTVVGGVAESTVETRLESQASQVVRAGHIRLVRGATESDPTTIDIAYGEGAATALHAPPDQVPTGNSGGLQLVAHLDLTPAIDVAYLGETVTQNVLAAVANELPIAAGNLSYSTGGGGLNAWVLNQAATGPTSQLLMSPNPGVVNLRAKNGVVLSGGTSATTGALGALDRRVETTATASFKDLRIMPTSFILGPNFERSVVIVEDFSASVSCNSTANTATAAASATWQATLMYWVEDDPNDGVQQGHYATVTLTGVAGGDPLAAIKDQNPMVYEDPVDVSPAGSPLDLYLFPVSHTHTVDGEPVTHDHAGYLESWSSLPTTSATDAEGRSTSADINGAIRIDTTPTNPSLPNSGLNVAIGKLGCRAVDNR